MYLKHLKVLQKGGLNDNLRADAFKGYRTGKT